MLRHERSIFLSSFFLRRSVRNIYNCPTISIGSYFRALLWPKTLDSCMTELREYFGHRAVYPTKNARSAIYLFLKACGIREGDEVIMSAFNCFVVPEAVILAGATPVYVDINEQMELDEAALAGALSPATKCIILPQNDGIDLEIPSVVADYPSVALLVDAAHSLPLVVSEGSRPFAKYIDGYIHSFSHSKIFSLMNGGILLAKDEMHDRLDRIYEDEFAVSRSRADTSKLFVLFLERLIGRLAYLDLVPKVCKKLLRCEPEIREEEYSGNGYDGLLQRMSPYKLRLLTENLQFISGWNTSRKRLAELYRRKLDGSCLSLIKNAAESGSPLQVPALFKGGAERLYLTLMKNNIYIARWFSPPLYPVGADLEKYAYDQAKYPVASRLSDQILNLPLSPRLTERDIDRVCTAIRKCTVENEN